MTAPAPLDPPDPEPASPRAILRDTHTALGQEVFVEGRMDVHTVAELRHGLHDALDGGTGDLFLHLVAAEIYDATGLGLIVGLHHRAQRQGRRLVLVDLSPRLDRLLRASRLHRVLTRPRAVAAIGR